MVANRSPQRGEVFLVGLGSTRGREIRKSAATGPRQSLITRFVSSVDLRITDPKWCVRGPRGRRFPCRAAGERGPV